MLEVLSQRQRIDAQKIIDRRNSRTTRTPLLLPRMGGVGFHEHGGFTICLLECETDLVGLGASFRSRHDKHNPKVGRHLAFKRAVMAAAAEETRRSKENMRHQALQIDPAYHEGTSDVARRLLDLKTEYLLGMANDPSLRPPKEDPGLASPEDSRRLTKEGIWLTEE